MDKTQAPAGMVAKTVPSPWPWYAAAAVVLLMALLGQFYLLSGYLLTAGLAIGAWVLADKFIPKQVIWVEQEISTGDLNADQVLKEGQGYLRQIRADNEAIANDSVSVSLASIEQSMTKIFAYVEEKPGKAQRVRKLLRYYLPTLTKLTGFYAKLEQQGIEGENITQSKARIDDNLKTLAKAFEKQLDVLFADEALDVTTDIAVLENMLRAEGLTEEGTLQEEMSLKL